MCFIAGCAKLFMAALTHRAEMPWCLGVYIIRSYVCIIELHIIGIAMEN